MSLLRYALIGVLCVCYAVCQQNDDARILDLSDDKDQEQNQIVAGNKKDAEKCICVKKFNCATTTPTSAEDPATLFTFSQTGCHHLEECCPPAKVIKSTTNPPPTASPLCGLSNLDSIGGNSSPYADYAEFPWMVALLKKMQSTEWSDIYIGGGSIIHPSVVVTSAHNVDQYEANEIKCRAGEWDTKTVQEWYPHQHRDVKKIVLHDEYRRLYLHNDVALLFLSAPFVLGPHIGIACLGRSLPPVDTKCYSMGWRLEDDMSKWNYDTILKKTQLLLVGQKECQKSLRNTRLGSKFTLHNSLMCVGGEEGVDTCIGDGGSPLVCPIENPGGDQRRYAVYGMVGYSVGCGIKDVPSVYVNIPQMYQWIAQQIVLEGFTKAQFDY